jgi:hypothetical protein
MQAADSEPLSFHVSMYCGQMIVSGRVAPSGWWYDVAKSGYRAELERAMNLEIARSMRKVRNQDERQALVDEQHAAFTAQLDRAESLSDSDTDEVTLVDVSVFPAVGTQGTNSAGQTLPIARIPLGAIDLWWIVSGDAIRGSGGSSIGWGFLFPIGN